MSLIQRRDFLATAAAAAASATWLRAAASDPGRKLEGIFPIMQTPFTDSGTLDVDTLIHEAQWLHRIGVQGMTWPQLASEYATLTYDERIAGAEGIVAANKSVDARTRPAVVIGVQAPDTETAVKYARHADKLGPDAIIAIPLGGGLDESKQMDYYAAIGAACSRPLIVQTIGNMSVDLVLRMAKQIPTLRYAKDEAGVTLPRLTEYHKRGQNIQVFSGKRGPTFIDELDRGAIGNMPGSGAADLYVAAWQAWKKGKREEAVEAFGRVLVFVSAEQAYGLPGQKYLLQLRGVFPNTKCRNDTTAAVFDDEAKAALRRTVDYGRKWFKA
jgi:4-hydroxy-tetrahydrodipicolinate synthase